jgi:hypothetical protein
VNGPLVGALMSRRRRWICVVDQFGDGCGPGMMPDTSSSRFVLGLASDRVRWDRARRVWAGNWQRSPKTASRSAFREVRIHEIGNHPQTPQRVPRAGSGASEVVT